MFQGWGSFYVLLGTAAVGLIGLLFVVVTLTGGRDRSKALRAVSIYMTPTVVNFAFVLATSAVAVAPFHTIVATALVLGAGAFVALANAAWACFAIRARTLGSEPPHWSDIWLYGLTPVIVCAALVVADIGVCAREGWAPTAIALLMLGLLLLGIRNAWDLVTWIAAQRGREPE